MDNSFCSETLHKIITYLVGANLCVFVAIALVNIYGILYARREPVPSYYNSVLLYPLITGGLGILSTCFIRYYKKKTSSMNDKSFIYKMTILSVLCLSIICCNYYLYSNLNLKPLDITNIDEKREEEFNSRCCFDEVNESCGCFPLEGKWVKKRRRSYQIHCEICGGPEIYYQSASMMFTVSLFLCSVQVVANIIAIVLFHYNKKVDVNGKQEENEDVKTD